MRPVVVGLGALALLDVLVYLVVAWTLERGALWHAAVTIVCLLGAVVALAVIRIGTRKVPGS